MRRENANDPIDEYTLQMVTYGTASAPYLAIRTLSQLANDIQNDNPTTAEIIRNDFYVDDYIGSAYSIDSAKSIYDKLKKVMRSAGFNLRKWATNCDELRNYIPKYDHADSVALVTTLGIWWNTRMDCFEIEPISQVDSATPRIKKRTCFPSGIII